VTSPEDQRRYNRLRVPCVVEIANGGQLQTCGVEDLGVGGAKVMVLFPMVKGVTVRVRIRSDRGSFEPNGAATVAWATRVPPYHVGLSFSDPLAEQVVRFIREVMGPVALVTRK
jgi:hypothetical protein